MTAEGGQHESQRRRHSLAGQTNRPLGEHLAPALAEAEREHGATGRLNTMQSMLAVRIAEN